MIVTFYSYKGGVGRSFCLANVAVQLARWGNRVLCVDFDLDAPGLHEYFKPYLSTLHDGGLVEVVAGDADWTDVVEPVFVPDAERLSLLAAGAMDSSYPDRAQALSWPDLFADHDLGWRFEKIRAEWEEQFDYVLIDSRTGITDIGGICTAQLPDVLVLCAVPNRQNLTGTLEVARRAAEARDKLPYDRAGLLYLPVVSRFDGKEEYERARKWRATMAEQFAPLYASWLPADQGDEQAELGLVERTTVPYLPYWSFGEEIAVVDERSGSPDTVSYYMDNIAALLAHRLADADVLVSSRDTYVSAARERGRRESGQGFRYDFLVHGTSERAAELHEDLLEFGVRSVRGRLAELPMVRHFVVVDPPERASAGIQEILDQVQLDPGRLVMVVGEAPKQLSSAHPISGSAVDVVSAVPAEDMGPHWEEVLVSAARRLMYRGELAAAHALAGRALEVAESPIRALLLRGELAWGLGRLGDAEIDLSRVLDLSTSNSFEAQRAHRLLGEIYRDRGDLASAVDHFQAALEAGGSDREQALVHRELARMELRAGRTDSALSHLGTARERSAGDVVLEAQVAFELGSMLVDRGHVEAAGRQLVDAVEWNSLPLDDQVTALRQLAYLETVAGRQRGAEEYLRRARDVAVQSEDKADIVIELARLRGGLDAIHEIATALQSLDSNELVARARLLEALGNHYLDTAQSEPAREAFSDAYEAFRRLDDRAGQVRALIGLTMALRFSDIEVARQTWDEARRLLTRLRGPEADLLRRQLDAVEPK
ncbi:KGGVGR-motif variant AAA ATPase [Lentzea kentuckyensis]|uniref:KGGVGR-motif variant AAA ATPase n=1 Tax=Lentzea kentuckyensis TaxID=360086 RepID=UPI001179C45E|nr:tetratricopeptide repeat protein [Lentzea kentuckyensis]